MVDEFESLFRTLDDPERWEEPRAFDRIHATKRFRAFATDLESRLSAPCAVETDSAIQDASFHSQIQLPGGWLRFSSFGDMIAFTLDHNVPEGVVNVVRELATVHKYTLIPTAVLEESYAGSNRGVTGISTWWDRFFDWV
jgi:hypothetical protein